MTPVRVARMAAVVTIGLVAVFVASTPNPGEGARLIDLLFATAILGAPLAGAVAVLAHEFASTDAGDTSERLLLMATEGMDESLGQWGAAMRAELASLESPRERRRFSAAERGTRSGRSRISPCEGVRVDKPGCR